MQKANAFIQHLHEQLRLARKAREVIRVHVLQSLIARIDNAEAIPIRDQNTRYSDNEFFAGAKSGLGSTEAVRKRLTINDIARIIDDEIKEIQHTIEEVHGQESYTEVMRQKLEILKSLQNK